MQKASRHLKIIVSLADLGAQPGMRPPPPIWAKISSFSCGFSGTIGQIVGWRIPLRIGAPEKSWIRHCISKII